MNKKCSKCKEIKPIEEFNKNSARSDGLQTFCVECGRKHSRKYYAKNKKRMTAQIIRRKQERVEKVREKLTKVLRQASCKDCGNSDERVLEFDHVSGDKNDNVGTLVRCGYSWETISAEIEKCEIVCANCHRIRTQERSNSWRNIEFGNN